MSKKRLELSNSRFGKLTVVKRAPDKVQPSGAKKSMWICVCDCGIEKTVAQTHLRSGAIVSCGCHSKEITSKRNTKHKNSVRNNRSIEYKRWMAMRARCNNPNTQYYSIYGGRGIKVCPEWDDFNVFLKDMGPIPSQKHTIERRNNDLGYNPHNCYWATAYEQCETKSVYKNNTSGHKHIVLIETKTQGTKYKVQITRRKTIKYTKTYNTIEQAIQNRDEWISHYNKQKT